MTLSDTLLKVHLMAVVIGAGIFLSFHQKYVAGLDTNICKQASFDIKGLKYKCYNRNNRHVGVGES